MEKIYIFEDTLREKMNRQHYINKFIIRRYKGLMNNCMQSNSQRIDRNTEDKNIQGNDD